MHAGGIDYGNEITCRIFKRGESGSNGVLSAARRHRYSGNGGHLCIAVRRAIKRLDEGTRIRMLYGVTNHVILINDNRLIKQKYLEYDCEIMAR